MQYGIEIDWGRVAEVVNHAGLFLTQWAGVACLFGALAVGIRRRYTYDWSPWFALVRKAWTKFGATSAVTWGALALDCAFLWAEAICGITPKPKIAKVEAVEEPATEPALGPIERAGVSEAINLAVEAREEAKAARRHAKSVESKLDALANVVLSPQGSKATIKIPSPNA